MTAQAQQAPPRVRETGNEGLVDTKLIGNPRSFPGKAEQRAEWRFVAEAHLAAVHLRRLLRDAQTLGPTPVDENELIDEMSSLSRQLY